MTLKRENCRVQAVLLVLRERDPSIEVVKEENSSVQVHAMKPDHLSAEVGTLEAQQGALIKRRTRVVRVSSSPTHHPLILFLHSPSSKGNGLPSWSKRNSLLFVLDMQSWLARILYNVTCCVNDRSSLSKLKHGRKSANEQSTGSRNVCTTESVGQRWQSVKWRCSRASS